MNKSSIWISEDNEYKVILGTEIFGTNIRIG